MLNSKFPTLRGIKPFYVGNKPIRLSKSTRHMEVLKRRLSRNLARIKKLAERRIAKAQNTEVRRQVRTLKAAKRSPRVRIRSRDEYGSIYFPRVLLSRRISSYKITSVALGTQYVNFWGEKKSIQDCVPVAKLNPPRNYTTIKSFRKGSNSASILCTPSMWQYPIAYQPSCPWALDGLAAYTIDTDISAAIGFDTALAQRALQKVYAKVNEATIQANEYLFEWKQVLRLLKDPLRTVMKFHRVLERWTRRDAWIYVPQRTYRRCGKGIIVGKTPTGGVLMSMRTKRTLSPTEVSDQMLAAAANRWLQYRYGIAPAVLDITTAISWYQGNLEKPWKRSDSARHTVSKSEKHTDYVSNTQTFTRTFHVSEKKGETYSAKMWYNIKYEPSLYYKLGVHPSQWLNVLWNALPFSFVADWFVNLDDWLTASRNPPWIEFGPNVVTYKVYQKIVARCIKVEPRHYSGPTYKLEVLPGLPTAVAVRESIRRELDLPRPTDLWASDRWTSLKNVLTGLALIYEPLIKRR